MISEKVRGANLLDFAMGNYCLLNESQKVKFFTRLGRIAMLDLVVGNLDRLIQIYYSDNQYQLDPMEVNLGNVMVNSLQEGANPVPYAIDDGIDPDLVMNLDCRQKYLAFLEKLLSNQESCFDLLVENISDSFSSALSTQIDDCQGSRAEIVKRLNMFSKDLQQLGVKAIRVGLGEMFNLLHESLIPAWNGESIGLLKNQMEKRLPQLHSSLTERFKLFQSMRNK